MAVTLHRCPLLFIRTKGHGCHNVQRALMDAGVEHRVVTVPLRRTRRETVIRLTGQPLVPTIEFDDGTAYREESTEMVERIRSDRLGATA